MIMQPKFWFWFSLATIIVSLIVIFTLRPVWGIDFVGGALLEVRAESAEVAAIQNIFSTDHLSATVQPTQEGTLLIRTDLLSPERHQEVLQKLLDQNLVQEELRFEAIGPTIGQGLRRQTIIAVLLSVVLMIAYLAYSFRGAAGLTAPWKFGVAAVYALIHDLIVVTAAFVVFGKLWSVPIDALFVTAQLAIFGYSVSDTIVLFTRLKSNWLAKRTGNMLSNIDQAIKATLTRSLNTSLTTVLTQVTLLTFGGATLRWFLVALVLGTVSGTYSSVFVAAPCLYYLTKRR